MFKGAFAVLAMMMLVVVASQTTAEAGGMKNKKHSVSLNSVAGSTPIAKQRKIRAYQNYHARIHRDNSINKK